MLVLALALPACGNDDGDADAVRETVTQAFAAFAERDPERLCGLLSSEAKLKLGTSAHGEPPFDCRRDAARQIGWIAPYRSGAEARIGEVATAGDGTAVAKLRLPDGTETALRAREEDGRWLLDGLFDASLSLIQAKAVPARDGRLPVWEPPPAPAADGSVTVRDAREPGRPRCPEIDVSAPLVPTGGCLLELRGDALELTLWTPFGVAAFGSCTISYTLRVDGAGNALVDDLLLDGPSPCDALACRTHELGWIPWPATVERDAAGALRLHVESACLNTCVGQFTGAWDIELAERAGTWRLRFASPLGNGGMRVEGAVAAAGPAIAIE